MSRAPNPYSNVYPVVNGRTYRVGFHSGFTPAKVMIIIRRAPDDGRWDGGNVGRDIGPGIAIEGRLGRKIVAAARELL